MPAAPRLQGSTVERAAPRMTVLRRRRRRGRPPGRRGTLSRVGRRLRSSALVVVLAALAVVAGALGVGCPRSSAAPCNGDGDCFRGEVCLDGRCAVTACDRADCPADSLCVPVDCAGDAGTLDARDAGAAPDSGAVDDDDGGATGDGGGAVDGDGGATGDSGAIGDGGGATGDGGANVDGGGTPLDAGGPGWASPGSAARYRATLDPGVLSGDVDGLPVLVAITPTWFDVQDALAGVDALRFYSDDGALMSAEVDGEPGLTTLVWVRVPVVRAEVAPQGFWIYAGGAPDNGAAPLGLPPMLDVWSGYGGVWHLGEDGFTKDVSGTYEDPSCAHPSHDAGCAARVTGFVGDGRDFTETDHHLNPSSRTDLDVPLGGAQTISAWFAARTVSPTQGGAIVYKEYGCHGWWIGLEPSGKLLATAAAADVDTTCGDTRRTITRSTATLVDDTWHHAAMIVDREHGRLSLYIDGAAAEEKPFDGGVKQMTSGPLRLGTSWDDLSRFDGRIDEVRIYDGALSADRVRLDFDAARDALLTYGPRETP